jgi:hypothetical protein
MRRLVFASLVAAGLAALPGLASAQAICTLPDENLINWPASGTPVWSLCWVRATKSSGGYASGLEIRNVYYNGHLALKRGHVPILNAVYEGGNCGGASHCYRDTVKTEMGYLTDNICPPPKTGTTCGYAEPSCPPVMECDMASGMVDVCTMGQPPPPNECGQTCFVGVSAEQLPDRLILSTQLRAGWYRYDEKWTFLADGTIKPSWGFSAVFNPCTSFTHRHHAYWRLDFDVDGPASDKVVEGPTPIGMGEIKTEAKRLNNQPGLYWEVTDRNTGRGYRLVPGAETENAPADTFAVADFWVLKYKPEELDDKGQPGPACAIKINPFINNNSLDQDLVVWYRTGFRHLDHDLDHCHVVGPTLVPVGDWSP